MKSLGLLHTTNMTRRMISILHIASDEKFINAANYIFEKAFPECNHFIIPHSRFNRHLRYVTKKKNVEIVYFGGGLINTLTEQTKKYDCIILHGITDINSTVFLSSVNKDKFIGILWGAELYTDENFPERSFKGDLTASLKMPDPKFSISERFKESIRKIIYPKNVTQKDASKLAASALSFFSVPYMEEFVYFKERKLISEECRLIPFTYYPLEYIMQSNESTEINGNDILLGNSASLTNNHLEAFQRLKTLKIDSRKIVVPLSYGNSLYADYIQAKGTELFNENFKPLRKFMALADYAKELSSCGIVIMNHFRQQAVGNIFMMIWYGSKVYLNESNTVFHYLQRIGIRVFSIENDLNSDNQNALCNLSRFEIDHNRTLLKKAIGEEHVIDSLKQGIIEYFL
jgi:dTDP-N-acetylfucosamine:lipid II N-acetylfucosaminyltransferase